MFLHLMGVTECSGPVIRSARTFDQLMSEEGTKTRSYIKKERNKERKTEREKACTGKLFSLLKSSVLL